VLAVPVATLPLDNDPSPVLAKLDGLLAERDDAGVKTLFSQMVDTYNRHLKAALLQKYNKIKAEGVSTEELVELFKSLELVLEQEAQSADQKLKAMAQPEEKQAKQPKPAPPRKRPLPDNLPVVANALVVPDGERKCPLCGADRVCIGHDVTRVIDIEPARIIVREDSREKLSCQTCTGEIVRAPLGDKVIEGGSYGARLVADLVEGKYDHGMPLERQHDRYLRYGFDMPRASMGDQITWATDLLAPIARALFDEVIGSDNLHLDATGLPVRDKDTDKGIKTGSLWGYVGIDVDKDSGEQRAQCVYLYNATGKKNGQVDGELGPEDVLALRRKRGKPNVIADASGLFDASFILPGLVEHACNMHSRRYFQKALEAGDTRAALAIGVYKKIYAIEEAIKHKSPAECQATRKQQSKPLHAELIAWCEAYLNKEPPKSLLGKAVGYNWRHRVALMRYLDDGTIPIDNGVVERLHKRPALGRKAYLFAGSDLGALRAAIAYSVLGTCRLLGLNGLDYLSDILPKLARGICVKTDLPALMPAAWLKQNPRSRIQNYLSQA